jgi:hypothetical protein
MAATNRRQEPFVYGSLGGATLAIVPAQEPAAIPAAKVAPVDSNSGLRRDYELAEKIGTKEVWDAFLAAHPTSFYSELARAQRAKVVARERDEARAPTEAEKPKGRGEAKTVPSNKANGENDRKAKTISQPADVNAKAAARPSRPASGGEKPGAAKASSPSSERFACNESGCNKVPPHCTVQQVKCWSGMCDKIVCP